MMLSLLPQNTSTEPALDTPSRDNGAVCNFVCVDFYKVVGTYSIVLMFVAVVTSMFNALLADLLL